jgi:hypothetical protein
MTSHRSAGPLSEECRTDKPRLTLGTGGECLALSSRRSVDLPGFGMTSEDLDEVEGRGGRPRSPARTVELSFTSRRRGQLRDSGRRGPKSSTSADPESSEWRDPAQR